MRIQPDRLKQILRVQFVFIACVVSALLFTPHAWGQDPDKDERKSETKVHASIELGAQIREIQGGHTAKFQEARDVPKGFFIQKLRLDFRPDDSPYFLALKGLEILERDQRF